MGINCGGINNLIIYDRDFISCAELSTKHTHNNKPSINDYCKVCGLAIIQIMLADYTNY